MTAEHDKAVTGDVEAIHRLRVATRRLRAALRMLCEVAPEDEAESAADELGWLCGAIGAVRDLDVLAQLLQDRATRLEADFIRALAPLSDTIRRQRAIEQERLVAALDSERYGGLVQRLGAIAPEPAADSVTLGAVAARLVRPQLRAMLRAGAGLDEASPPGNLASPARAREEAALRCRTAACGRRQTRAQVIAAARARAGARRHVP